MLVLIYRISSNKPLVVYLFQLHKLCAYYSRAQTNQGCGLFHSASYTYSTDDLSMRNWLPFLIVLPRLPHPRAAHSNLPQNVLKKIQGFLLDGGSC